MKENAIAVLVCIELTQSYHPSLGLKRQLGVFGPILTTSTTSTLTVPSIRSSTSTPTTPDWPTQRVIAWLEWSRRKSHGGPQPWQWRYVWARENLHMRNDALHFVAIMRPYNLEDVKEVEWYLQHEEKLSRFCYMSLKSAVRKMDQQCMQPRLCRRMQCAQYSGKDLYISKLCISAEKLQSFVSSFGVKELEN